MLHFINQNQNSFYLDDVQAVEFETTQCCFIRTLVIKYITDLLHKYISANVKYLQELIC